MEAEAEARYYDIIGTGETFLSPGEPDSHLTIDGFNFFRADRSGKEGGGVGMYVREFLTVKVLACSTGTFENKPEYLVSEISCPNKNLKFLCGLAYCRPQANYPAQFFNLLATYLPHYENVIIMGDLNIDVSSSSNSSKRLHNYLHSHNLNLVSTEPTHHCLWRDPSSHTCIDLFIVNNLANVLDFRKSQAPFIAGHDFIETTLKIVRPPVTTKTIKTRSLNAVDRNALDNALSHHFNDHALSSDSSLSAYFSNISQAELMPDQRQPHVDHLANRLTRLITTAFDTVAPVKTVTLSSKRKPWAKSMQIKRLMRTRDRAYKIYRRSTTTSNREKYRRLRSQVKNLLDSSKNEFIKNAIANSKSLGAKWRTLKNLHIVGSSSSSPLDHFSAEDLNTYYASIVRKAAPATRDDLDRIIHSRPLDPNRPIFNFRPVTQGEIRNFITQASSKGCGVDGISVQMLKLTLPHLLEPLTELCNHCLENSIFPTSWKQALVLPILKSKNPSSPSDTRPIALLPEISKILEKAVHAQLTEFLEAHSLLYPGQAGFRPGHSTQTALLRVTDDVRQAIDDQKLTILILFDFSKAFDTLPHPVLLSSLRELNMSDSALSWFFSYLTDRIQAVIDKDGNITTWLSVDTGVPQGSGLGPPCFSVSINNLHKVLRYSESVFYADDSQIYLHCLLEELLNAIRTISLDAQAVADWARMNGLSLNASKSKVMILGSSKVVPGLDLSSLPKIKVDDSELEYVTEIKNLGVILSSTLDFKSHTKMISSKIYSSLFSLRFFRHSLSKSLRIHLVQSLLLPHFDYASSVFLYLDKTLELKLQTAQNACVRFVCGYIPRDSHVTPHRLDLGWLSVRRRREYLCCTLAYKIIATGKPTNLASDFSRINVNVIRRRSPRNPPEPFIYDTRRTRTAARSFVVQASDLLNSLHVVDFDMEHFDYFKQNTRQILFARDIRDWNTRIMNEGLNCPLVPLQGAHQTM